MSVILGTMTDRDLVSIGDTDRTSGLYILGRPRVGKSWLIVNLILQDIEKGRGIFFLDPHGDAIDDLIDRAPLDRLMFNCTVLDPEKQHSTFGLNPLYCPDVNNPKLLNDTYAKAKGLFDKLWKNTFEEKPWLQLILQNTLYALIENQGYTLAELPLFFRDASFRAYICNNIKHNIVVRDYWLKTFASKSRQTQEEQMEAAQTRAEIMLSHPYVLDIFCQRVPTIDFAFDIKFGRINLVRLSASLPYEVKKIIGTALISELLYAIDNRQERHLFCVYVDEFQTFASYEDFTVMITRAPKLGVATTLAHHERYGQLLDDPQIMGATAAIPNKVLFQITPKDAQELAGEFAEKPPFELKREPELTISMEPVDHLLSRGHQNQDISDFANRVIRPMKEALSDTRDEIEGERLIRMDLLDEAAIARIEERMVWVDTRGRSSGAYLDRSIAAIEEARERTARMQEILTSTKSLKKILRAIDRALSAVMQGKTGQGKEDFAQFLIGLVREFNRVPSGIDKILELYISLYYGEVGLPRAIPFDFSDRQGLFSEERRVIRQALAAREENERAELRKTFPQKHWTEFYEHRTRWRDHAQWIAEGERIAVSRLMRYRWARVPDGRVTVPAYRIYADFARMQCFREVRRLVEPYLERELSAGLPCSIADLIYHIDNGFDPHMGGSGIGAYTDRLREDVIRDLFRFLRRYKEGAYTALTLIYAARTAG